MPLNQDRYPYLGPRRRVANFDQVIMAVRQEWPTAYCEGSTGYERTWFWRNPDLKEPELIAHSRWVSSADESRGYYVRVTSSHREAQTSDVQPPTVKDVKTTMAKM
jgi:hypothetical protein